MRKGLKRVVFVYACVSQKLCCELVSEWPFRERERGEWWMSDDEDEGYIWVYESVCGVVHRN